MANDLYTTLIRPLLFKMQPETAHHFSMSISRWASHFPLARSIMHQNCPPVPTTLMGLSLKNPVGLAAGLDKEGKNIDAWGLMGFGFVEVGTVTPLAQPGKPQPRLFRLPQAQALINRMGFNNEGLAAFIEHIKARQYFDGALGLNIGKNAATPMERAIDDYITCLDGVYPHADYITINISSPNTENLRSLQSEGELAALLGAIQERRKLLADQHGRHTPIAVKIAPDLTQDQIKAIADTLVHFGMDGVIATNTTLAREAVAHLPHGQEAGGLSGAPVFEASNAVIRSLRAHLGSDFPIIGVGGIDSGEKAVAKLQAGANAVQLYTGLIYRGPALIAECCKAIGAYQKSVKAA